MCITKGIHLEKPKRLIIWNGGSTDQFVWENKKWAVLLSIMIRMWVSSRDDNKLLTMLMIFIPLVEVLCFPQCGTSHCSLEDVHFYSLSRSCILHLFTKTNVGMSNTSYSCGYSPCALYALAAQMMQSWKKWRRLIWLSKRARRWTNKQNALHNVHYVLPACTYTVAFDRYYSWAVLQTLILPHA